MCLYVHAETIVRLTICTSFFGYYTKQKTDTTLFYGVEKIEIIQKEHYYSWKTKDS